MRDSLHKMNSKVRFSSEKIEVTNSSLTTSQNNLFNQSGGLENENIWEKICEDAKDSLAKTKIGEYVRFLSFLNYLLNIKLN